MRPFRRPLPDHWNVRYEALGLTFKIHPTSFKHTGLFPEQAVNWDWFSAKIKAARDAGREVSVLNLFGYTGAATCAAAKAESLEHPARLRSEQRRRSIPRSRLATARREVMAQTVGIVSSVSTTQQQPRFGAQPAGLARPPVCGASSQRL